MSLLKQFLLATTIAVICCAEFAHAEDTPWVPEMTGRVSDEANVLSAGEREDLEEMLESYEKETRHQIAVLIIPFLSGEPIESFSFRVANAWKLGKQGVDNGILLTLAMQERKVRIEVGKGLEPYISNAKAAQIIREAMIPEFKQGDFADGIEEGLEALMKEARKFVLPRAGDHSPQ